MNRIKDKINEIQIFLEELDSVLPEDLETYLRDFKIKAVCERYFEKIIEGIVDLSFLIIKEKNLKIPEDDKNVFDVLGKEKIISKNLSEKLKDAKGMRNIIAHEYGKINDELIFEAVKEELIKDSEEFLSEITRII